MRRARSIRDDGMIKASDWIMEKRKEFRFVADMTCDALQEAAVALREADERIRNLEREKEELKERLRQRKNPR